MGFAVAIALVASILAPRAALAASFTVNNTGDTVDASPGNGVCADASNNCTLRAAIMEANALAGADTITLSDGSTYTLTRTGVDNTAVNGDLDVTGPLTINGNGAIIEAGARTSTAIDRVFSFNPTGSGVGFTVSLNNLTIRNGRNPNAFSTFESDGGCFDFDSGTNGAGSLNLSSVTVTDCATTDGDGGGTAVFLGNGGTVTINNSTIQNNTTARSGGNPGNGGGIAFFCVNNGATANVSISNSAIRNNSTGSSSSTVVGNGGGLFFFGGCSTPSTATLNYQLHAVTVTGNSADSDGGGIYSTAPLTIDNVGGATTISNNTSGGNGGGIRLSNAGKTSTISKVTITNNTATGAGGGIRLDGGTLNMSFSRIVNNTSAAGTGNGLSAGAGINATATANVTNNWWGCSTGPSAAPCDVAKADPPANPGINTVTASPWLRVLTTASPSTISTNQTSILTASFLTNSVGTAIAASDLTVLIGLPVAWSAVGGNIIPSQTNIQANGSTTATYQATAALAGNRAAAKVDNDGTTTGSNVVSITVNKAGTITTITNDTPDPTVTGQPYTVSFIVASVTGSSPTAPSGSVTISDGTSSCTSTLASPQCTLVSTTAGAKTLTAVYSGDANFLASTSTGVAHTVNKADTTTTITSDTPDPSVVGQPVTINYGVSVNAPGAGTPTGTVTMSDGTQSCTGTVAAGSCTITFTSAGSKTLTATYGGDANFNASPASASATHTVNKANTTTTITGDNPDPSAVGQAVVVQYTVTANAPGAGTLTGNVTVSDGVDSCTATVAAGQCSITLTTPGSRTLTATYAGDSNFNSSSDTEPHTVNMPDLTIAKTHTGNFDQGQTGAQYTITVSNGGTGATSGTVTVVDTLPTGLTATAISGSSWSCDLATLTCTRSDALAAGSSYPDITLTVDVAANAPASVTNTATVSGGGETNTGNDTANDQTTIGAVDTTKPSVTINQAAGQADPTSSSPINFTVVFDEPVTGFTSSDVNLSGTAGATTAVVTEVSPNNGTTYNVAVSRMTSSGTVIASIPAGAAQDAAGNTSNASTSTDNSVQYNAAPPTAPDLTITKSHSGAFTQGQTGAQYTITVKNSGNGATSGTVTVVDTLPTGLTATAISGSGWSCTLATLTCTRSDALAAGSSYPTITLTVNVAANAPASVTNTATVSGGGETNTGNDTTNDPTTINTGTQQTIYLTIVKSHNGNFTQGQTGAQYTITVKNTGTAPSSGTVTVVDTLPTGLTATAISGSGWSCTLGTLTCTRSDAVAGASSYPNITLTVNVASNAPSSVTNTATVSGGGDQNTNDNTANDPTTITSTSGGSGAQLVPDACDSSKTALVVTGTSGNDKIEVKQADGGKVQVTLNGTKLGSFSPTGRIIVLGQAGNDTITIKDDIKQLRIVYGGDGNDTIKDENGRGILIGGNGDDKLTGGDDRDIAIGGSGADTIKASDRNDILIAGSTSYDEPSSANQASLCSIQAEWLRTDLSYEARISHLNGTTTGGLNGANVLKPGQTVFDDTSKDKLTGGDEQDWFLANVTGSGTLDTITDRKSNETVTDL